METAKRTAILLILALLTTTIAQPDDAPLQAEPSQASKISQTRTASCLVKVTADPEAVTLDIQTIQYLLESSAVADDAACEVLQIKSLQGPRPFKITVEQLTGPPAGRLRDAVQRTQSRQSSTVPGSAPPLPTTPAPIRSSSSARSSSNQLQQPPRPASDSSPPVSGRSSSRYSTRSPLTQQPTPAYGDETPARGWYGNSYRRNTSTIGDAPQDAGSASRYGSSYSRTRGAPGGRLTTRSSATPRPTNQTQTILFRLQIDIIDDSVKPEPKDFMGDILDNLETALRHAVGQYADSLQSEIDSAQDYSKAAREQLQKMMEQARPEVMIQTVERDPANEAVKEQLDEIVDLSNLTPEMSFAEALDDIKNSVDPPLEIVVLWRDVYDNAEIEPTTEINMSTLSQAPLHKGLSLLLKSVAGSDGYKLTYSIGNGVITIASAASIPRDMVTIVHQIPGFIYSSDTATELADVIIETIAPDSWSGLSEDSAQAAITPYMNNKLIVHQTVEVHLKIRQFLENIESPLAIIPPDISPETFLYERQELQRQRRMVEMDVARMKARRTATEQAIAQISNEVDRKMTADLVTTELQKILETSAGLLTAANERHKAGAASLGQVREMEQKLARARIELAKRREELSKAAGGDQIAKLNSELTSLSIDLAEKTAELQILNAQLGQTEAQLAMATTLNPKLSELRYAKEASDAAQQRASQLKTRLANLTPPTVTVIGAD